MSGKSPRFDRDMPLADLLRAVPRPRLLAALTRTLGSVWRIVDADGNCVLEPEADALAGVATVGIPLRVDIEDVARLEAPEQRRALAEAAARWLELVLVSGHRYLMAADLHAETVSADFETLQRQHAALQESEARYRALAEQLDRRVQEQVAVIERTQRQLYVAEKLASVGSLAAGMAHEINNPLGFIRSNLGTAQSYGAKMGEVLAAFRRGDAAAAGALWDRLDMDFVLEDFPGLLAESTSGADRVARIVANLKAYSNIDCDTAAPVDLNQAVHAAAEVLAGQVPANVNVELALGELPVLFCDLSRMNQVMFALLQNAFHALDANGGTIRIESGVDGNAVRVAISDTGCGIDPHLLGRIFDPFFTTRDVGKGMGLGLTVSRDIVTAHGGRIEVASTPGRGSVFSVWLPLDRGAPARHPGESNEGVQ